MDSLVLQEYSTNVSKKFVVLDQGGELYHNAEVFNLFCQYKYKVFPTGANASYQNDPVTFVYYTIATSICALLFGDGLSVKLYLLLIWNTLTHCTQIALPLYLSTGKKDNFKNLSVLGCQVLFPSAIKKKRVKEDAW